MKSRFAGDSGKRILPESLRDQKIVSGNPDLAQEIASVGTLVEVNAHTSIITQGGDDNDVYLIVAGSFDIVVDGRAIAKRYANDHVGEMAALQHARRRAATVIAREDSVVVKITEPDLARLGEKYPQIWHCLARELARRQFRD